MKHLRLLLLGVAIACNYSPHTQDAPLVSIQIQDRNGLTETISTPERLVGFETTNFSSSQPYKKVVRVYKQNGKNTAKITTYHPNGTIWQYLETQDMRALGPYKEWYSNGALKIEANVIGGVADINPSAQKDWLFDGVARVYDDQSRPVAEIPYDRGSLEGEAKYYYPNQNVEKTLLYHNNELHGNVMEYEVDGALRSKVGYQAGEKAGLSEGYWAQDQLSWKEQYSNGLLLDGQYFSSNGELISEIKNGHGFQILFEDGYMKQKVEIRKGKPEGIVQIFTASGELSSSYHVKQGKKHGEELEYYFSYEVDEDAATPLVKLSVPWVDDTISGIVKTWYSNGKLESQREVSRNKKTGTALAWYCDGGLMYMEEYEEDRLVKGTYYKKNQKDSVSSVQNGSGIATIFDENGTFVRKVQYIKGKPVDLEE